MPGSGFALDASVALVDDAVDGGESEAGGLGGVFGGEEWFEDAAAGWFVHADAGIGDGEDDAGVGGSAVGLGRFERRRSGGDSQGATGGHGGAGIVGQLHEDQVELIGIDDDGGEGFLQAQFNGDSGAEGAVKHGEGAAHAFVEVDDAGLQKLEAAEGQQLLGDFSGARGLVQDAVELGLNGRRQGRVQGQLAGEADGLGDVVEVVRDAAGEASDGFHAMGVVELLFEFVLAGEVADIGEDVLVSGFGVDAERAGDGDAEQAAVVGCAGGSRSREGFRWRAGRPGRRCARRDRGRTMPGRGRRNSCRV